MPPSMNAQIGGAYQPTPAPPVASGPIGGPFQTLSPPVGYGMMSMGAQKDPGYSGISPYTNNTGSVMPGSNQLGMFNEYEAATDPRLAGSSSSRVTGAVSFVPGVSGGSASNEPWLNEFGTVPGAMPNDNLGLGPVSNPKPAVGANSRYGGAENVAKSSIESKSSRYGSAAYRRKPDQNSNTPAAVDMVKAPLVEIPKNLFGRQAQPGFVAPAVMERFTRFEVGGNGEPRITNDQVLRNLNTRNYDVPPSKSTSSVSRTNEAPLSLTTTKRSGYQSSTEPSVSTPITKPEVGTSSISASSIPASSLQKSSLTRAQNAAMAETGHLAAESTNIVPDSSLTVLDAKIQELKSLSNRLAELQELLSKNTQITQPVVPTTTIATTTRARPTTTTAAATTTTAAATTTTTKATTTPVATTTYRAPATPVTKSIAPAIPTKDPLNEKNIQKLWEMYLNINGGVAPNTPAAAAVVDPLALPSSPPAGNPLNQAAGSIYQDPLAGNAKQTASQTWAGDLGVGFGGAQQPGLSADPMAVIAGFDQLTAGHVGLNSLQSLTDLLGPNGANAAFDPAQLSGVLSGTGYDITGTASIGFDPAATSFADPGAAVAAAAAYDSAHMSGSQGFNSFDPTALLSQTGGQVANFPGVEAAAVTDLAALAAQIQTLSGNYPAASQALPDVTAAVNPPFDAAQQAPAVDAFGQPSYDTAAPQGPGSFSASDPNGDVYRAARQKMLEAAGYGNAAASPAAGSPGSIDYPAGPSGQGQPSGGYTEYQGTGFETHGVGYSVPSTSYNAQGTPYETATNSYPQEATYYNGTTMPPNMKPETSSYIKDLKAKMLKSIKHANSRKAVTLGDQRKTGSNGVSWQKERWSEMSATQKANTKAPLPTKMKTAISKIADKLTQSMSNLGKNDTSLPMNKNTIMSALQNIAAGISKRQITKRSSPAPLLREMHEKGVKKERILKPLLDLAAGNATENMIYSTQQEGVSGQQINVEQLLAVRRRFEMLRKLNAVIQARQAQQILMSQPVQESTPSASDLFPGSSVDTMQIIDTRSQTHVKPNIIKTRPQPQVKPNVIETRPQPQVKPNVEPVVRVVANATIPVASGNQVNDGRSAAFQQLSTLLRLRMLNQQLSAGKSTAMRSRTIKPNETFTQGFETTTVSPAEVTTSPTIVVEQAIESTTPSTSPQNRAAVLQRLRRVLEMRKAFGKLRMQQGGRMGGQEIVRKPAKQTIVVPTQKRVQKVPTVAKNAAVVVQAKVAVAAPEPVNVVPAQKPAIQTGAVSSGNVDSMGKKKNVIVMPLNRQMLMQVLHTIRNKNNGNKAR